MNFCDWSTHWSHKIVTPPVKDMVDHPRKFLVFWRDANAMQDFFHMKLGTKNC